MFKNIVIIGSSGALGSAFSELLSARYPSSVVHCFSSQKDSTNLPNIVHNNIDYREESSIEMASRIASEHKPIDLVLVSTGILHDKNLSPEKKLDHISADSFLRIIEVNTLLPALIAKHFLPKLNKSSPAVFVALSARVGSISENQRGGWYAYRASKAALNMIIKTASIEMRRLNKNAIVVGLHPGTVDSSLSRPFQKNIPAEQLFSPNYSANKLLEVIVGMTSESSGYCFSWDGKKIPA